MKSPELLRAWRNGAMIVVSVGPFAGDEVEYNPKGMGDRRPWRLAGPADNGARFQSSEVRAQWQH